MRVKLNGNDFFEVSSPFASIDSVHVTPHTGVDLIMETGTKLFSPVDGVVKKVVDFGSENIGKGVYIETGDHQTVIMGHLSDFKVSEGQSIHQGDLVALSGNTGHSTGSHLHLGLKDADGSFVNPEPLLNSHNHEGIITKMMHKDSQEVGIVDGVTGFMDFISEVKAEGLFHAIYGKSFFEVCKDFFAELFHDIGVFILGNGDLLFLMPAILFMFGTFIIGSNKCTKWILPLWFAYFVSSIFHKMLLQ